jgi:hypothetical protein
MSVRQKLSKRAAVMKAFTVQEFDSLGEMFEI